MKFNTAIQSDKKAAFSHFMKLANKKQIIDIKKVSPGRTLRQNAYLHLLIGYFGVHFGYTLEEAKQIYKQLNASIYRYEKKGRIFWRSSAELTKEEMMNTIDNFREKSSEQGCPLPPATDPGWLQEIENEIERNRHLLYR